MKKTRVFDRGSPVAGSSVVGRPPTKFQVDWISRSGVICLQVNVTDIHTHRYHEWLYKPYLPGLKSELEDNK